MAIEILKSKGQVHGIDAVAKILQQLCKLSTTSELTNLTSEYKNVLNECFPKVKRNKIAQFARNILKNGNLICFFFFTFFVFNTGETSWVYV